MQKHADNIDDADDACVLYFVDVDGLTGCLLASVGLSDLKLKEQSDKKKNRRVYLLYIHDHMTRIA